jgi:protein-tyrosine phosphatase
VGGQYIKPKDAYMSSTWYESPLYHPIKYCFDNITTTSREAMCHTGYNSTYYDPNPRLWAFYDCPSTHTILTSVQLWNRQDCCDDRMQTFEVAFLDGFGKEDLVLPLTGTPKIWTLNTGIKSANPVHVGRKSAPVVERNPTSAIPTFAGMRDTIGGWMRKHFADGN